MHSSVQAGAAAGKRADESNRGESRVVEKRTKKLEGKRVVKKQGERERERERGREREKSSFSTPPFQAWRPIRNAEFTVALPLRINQYSDRASTDL